MHRVNDMSGFEDWIHQLPGWGPEIVAVLLTVVITAILGRVFTFLLERPLRRFLAKRSSQVVETIMDRLILPIRLAMLALSLRITLELLPNLDASDLLDNLVTSIIGLSLVIVFYRLINIVATSSNQLFDMTGIRIEARLLPLVRNTFKLMVGILGILFGLQQWGVNVSALVASLGIVGLGISLAAQDTIANLFGFGVIIGDRPFVVGEFIKTPDVEGIVEDVGVRSTRIRKPDQALITMPNAKLASSPVERFARRRISFVLGVTYETTADEMEELLGRLREMLRSRQHIVASSVAVYFTAFGASSLDVSIFCDVLHRDWHSFMREREQINLAVMRMLAEMGLSVAFPTQSIYIEGGQDHLPNP